MKLRALLIPITFAIALPVLAACGGEDPTPTQSGPLQTLVEVELNEWNVIPIVNQSGSGSTVFHVTNAGTLEHELVVFKTGLEIDELPLTADGKIDESAGEIIGEIEPDELQPGAEATATFALGTGNYILLCNLPGHFQAGMRANFALVN